MVAVLVALGVLARGWSDAANLTAELPLLLVAFTLGGHLPQHTVLAVLLGGAASASAALTGSSWLMAGIAVAAAFVLGAQRRQHSERLRGSLRRHRRVLLDERRRVAADLHDGSDPELRRLTRLIRESGGKAVTELGILVAELRGKPARGPDFDGIPDLVRAAGAAGNEVELRVGEVPSDLRAEVGAETYRVLREALTNVVKHASPTRVLVQLGTTDGALSVTVANDRCRAVRPRSLPGTGVGVQGMRERVHRLGGSLEAGGVAGGGFRVHAVIPLEKPARRLVPSSG